MYRHYKHLYKMFLWVLPIWCFCFDSIAVIPVGQTVSDNPLLYEYTANVAMPAHPTVQTLCQAGTYLLRCGSNQLGFNWLKSATFSTPTSVDPNATTTTKNYYDGVTTAQARYEQMRAFFNGNAALQYHDGTNIVTATPDDVHNDRYLMLSKKCNPFDSNQKAICATCPNNANVMASTVVIDSTNNTTSAWRVYTFADCYFDEFQDSTGTYIYVANTVNFDNPDAPAEKCYYSPSPLPVVSFGAIDFTTFSAIP